ncbi:MAG: Rrf2 family transcriptional regulator [Bacteroidota bacterium]
MKITAQEEYGLRVLIRLANHEGGLCIAEISQLEGMTHHNAAKLCRVLRMKGYILSKKGHEGGYTLALPPEEVVLSDLIRDLGGPLYDKGYCERFTGLNSICTNSLDCTVRSLWRLLQDNIDDLLSKLTLRDLIGKEKQVEQHIIDCTK